MAKPFISAGLAICWLTACGGSSPDAADAQLAGDAATIDVVAGGDPATPTSPDELPAIVEDISEEVAPDISITVESEMLTAAANIDGAITSFAPALSDRIKADVELAFAKAKAMAAEDAESGSSMAHDYQYDFIKSASVGDLISVEYMNMFYTGGAHPNYVIGGILHDRASGEDIAPSLLLSEAGQAKMKAHLMDVLAKKKLQRMLMTPEDLPALREEVMDVFPKEVEYWFGGVTLVPSKEAGKFGGLVVHYSPYEVGSYAEGSYDILVKASELGGMLSDTYAPMFGGEPDIEEVDEH